MRWLPAMPVMGVNLFDAPTSIADNECLRTKNLVPVPPGRLSKRGGLARPAKAVSASTTEKPVVALISPITDSPVDLVIVSREPSGTLVRLHATAVANLTIGSAFTQQFWAPRPWLLAWDGKAYMLPGPQAQWANDTKFPYYVMSGQPGSGSDDVVVTGVAFASSIASPAGNDNVFPSIAVPYKQRLCLMNFGRGYGNTIAFTDDYTADVVGDDLLASNGRSISLVAGDDGDEIVAGIEVMLTNVGSPAESGLLILRRYGTPFLLTGDMDQTTGGTSTLNIKRISINCGCAGPYTVVRTPVGIIWAGVDDVWAFAAGVLPTRIGQKIQPVLKITPAQLQSAWTGVYFNGFYRLSIWGEGQPLDLSSPPGDTWWLDLREGLPQEWRQARWWGPQQYLGQASIASPTPSSGIWVPFAETRAGKDACLYYVDHEPGVGMTIGEYSDGPRDLTAQVTDIADADYIDPEVLSELITKEYALKPPYQQVNDGVMATVRADHNVLLTAEFTLDDGAHVSDRDKPIRANSPFQLDSSLLDADASLLNNKVTPVRINPTTRRAASTHKFRIYDTAGHLIIAGVNDCLYIVVQDVPNVISYQLVVTIAAGAYSITDLAAAVVSAYNAAKLFGNNWSASFTAGILTLDGGGLYATSVDIAIRFLAFPAEVGTAPTQAQLDACRRLAAILGFDVSAAITDRGLTPLLIGDLAPFKKDAAHWELSGLQINMDVISRTP